MRSDTREDGYAAARRGEGGKEDSVLEGMHAEDNPALVGMIDRTQRAAEAARNGDKGMTHDDLLGQTHDKRLWFAVNKRGGIDFNVGDIDAPLTHIDEVVDDDLEGLRAMRLGQIKEKQMRGEEWKRQGHGKYTELNSDREFFEEVAKHDRCVVALFDANAQFDSGLVHAALERIAPIHLETKLCCISNDKAPMLSMHINVERLPVIFLVRAGKVVDKIPVDRSFTAEGVAYELADKGFLDSDETVVHRQSKQQQQHGSSVRSGQMTNPHRMGSGAVDDDDDDDYD